MPEGDSSFLQSKGPQKILSLRVSADVHDALVEAAAEMNVSKTSFGRSLLEAWADEYLSREVVDA